MTVVIAQHFLEGIVVIADSRSSIEKNGVVVPWRDNVQKIFFLTPHLIIGLAGDIEFAGSIISFLADAIQKRPKLGLLNIFTSKSPKLVKYAYDQITQKTRRSPVVGFIIAGIDFSRPNQVEDAQGKFIGHVNIYDKKIFKVASPNFVPENISMSKPFVIMGSGEPGIVGLEKDFHKLTFGQVMPSLDFQAAVMQHALSESIKKLGISSVGGLYQVAIIDNQGPRFQQYQGKREPFSPGDLDVEMIIRNGRFVQRDLKTSKEVELLYPPEVVKIKDDTSDLFADLESL